MTNPKPTSPAEIEEKWRREGRLPGQMDMPAATAGPGSRLLPPRWSPWYVLDRLLEMYLVLGRTAARTKPRAFSNSMPQFPASEEDMRGRAERFGFAAPGLWVEMGWDDLERAHRQRNRPMIPPTPEEQTRCEQAMGWTPRYIGSRPGHEQIAKAVLYGAQWHAYGMNVAEQCRRLQELERKLGRTGLGLTPKTLRRRQTRGLLLITAGLLREKVPVS